jgi:hypothetical protein
MSHLTGQKFVFEIYVDTSCSNGLLCTWMVAMHGMMVTVRIHDKRVSERKLGKKSEKRKLKEILNETYINPFGDDVDPALLLNIGHHDYGLWTTVWIKKS